MPGQEGPHPLVRTGSPPLPLHQQNQAATRPCHLMQPRPVAPTQASGWMASSHKRNGSAATSRATAIIVASPSTHLPPTVATPDTPNLLWQVALPSLSQVNQR